MDKQIVLLLLPAVRFCSFTSKRLGVQKDPLGTRSKEQSISKLKQLSKNPAHYLTVDENSQDQRIDNFLFKTLKGIPKTYIYRILRSGEVRVNGGRAEPTHRVRSGDAIRIPPMRAPDMAQRLKRPTNPYGAAALARRYEDDAIIVIDKAAGIAVHGGSGISHGVIERLRAEMPDAKFLELVHRLDRETSGLLLIAKKRSALLALHNAMREGRIKKRYQALVLGNWAKGEKRVELSLHKYLTAEGERRVRVDSAGQHAITDFRVLARCESFTLLEAQLHTGRTHQIRVHLAHLGYPIAGDDKYGDFEQNKRLGKLGLKRMFLHAASLDLKHPLTGEQLQFAAPLPEELHRFADTVLNRETGPDS